MTNLPKHLQEVVNNYEEKCRKFGLNPNFAQEALNKANKSGNDFNPIHALV